tara:strand:- start:1014 stop:1211 length:198 start_codon:yes stop_codon:yes gene_type:complete
MYILTHKNGEEYGSPFMFTQEMIENLQYNLCNSQSKPNVTYTFVAVGTRRTITITSMVTIVEEEE